MSAWELSPRTWRTVRRYGAVAVTAIMALGAAAAFGQQGKLQLLRIGTSGTLTAEGGGQNEKSSLDT